MNVSKYRAGRPHVKVGFENTEMKDVDWRHCGEEKVSSGRILSYILLFKGTVNVTLKWYVRFTIVPFKPLSDRAKMMN